MNELEQNINVIAIDGPSGAGKSTIAKKVAKILNFEYIDTGAMYRCVAYKCIKDGITHDNINEIKRVLDEMHFDIISDQIYLDGIIMRDEIRSEEISKGASDFSKLAVVREKMVALQRQIGESKSVVMDGRDIGTNVFPSAKYKFYIDASSEERARRRYRELSQKGENVNYEDVLNQILNRDYKDSTREMNPLKKADDAIEIDTTNLTIEQVCDMIILEVKK